MYIKIEDNYKKIVISFLATLAFTGCGGGGGGGGGGSSAPTPTPLPEPPEIQRPNIDISKPDNNIGVLIGKDINLEYGKTIEIVDKGSTSNFGSGIDKIIDINGYSYGIYSKNGKVRNSGNINIFGDSVIGIYGENSDIINRGNINGNANNLIGILAMDLDSPKMAINNGNIYLKGSNAIGMKLHNASGVNNETITVDSLNGIGMSVVGKDSVAVNNGDINILGNGIGIYAGYQATGKNNKGANINIYGSGYGMYANNHGYVLNEGNIKLSANARGAMVADGAGSVAENRGTIIIDSKNHSIKGNEIQAINGGKVLNSGEIIYQDSVVISAKSGVYMIDGNENSYGKIKANSIKVDGNMALNGDIVKGSYRNSYLFKKVLDGNSVEFGKDYKLVSNSLLYDTKLEKDSDGDYNSKLIRNNKNISDFANSDYLSSAKILDRYFTEKNYNSLDDNGKKIIDFLNISNIENLNNNLRDLTPSLYGNNMDIARDIERKFKDSKKNIVKIDGEEEYNFALIGGCSKMNSKDNIVGYKIKSTGFIGSLALEKGYLSLGYSYNDIDFKDDMGNGKTDSLYLSYDNYLKFDRFNLKYGVSGEYNFNEIERKMKSFDKTGKADFNSYIVKIYGEASKKYNSILNLKPYLALDFGYYNSETIKEKSDILKIEIDDKESFYVEPKVGLNISKKFDNLSFYGDISYSYEFNDRELEYRYSGINEKGEIKSNENSGKIDLKIGLNYEKENIIFNLETGKNFGRRENDFIVGKIGYRF